MRTMTASLVAVTAVSVLLMAVRLAEWLVDSIWHLIVVCAVVGAVVVARQRRSRVSLPTINQTRVARTPQRAAAPSMPRASQRSQVAYWGGVRVGTFDNQGRFLPDKHPGR